MRGDKSFAYDLFVPHRRVSSRVVLLLRSTERKRSRPRFVDLQSPIDFIRACSECRRGFVEGKHLCLFSTSSVLKARRW